MAQLVSSAMQKSESKILPDSISVFLFSCVFCSRTAQSQRTLPDGYAYVIFLFISSERLLYAKCGNPYVGKTFEMTVSPVPEFQIPHKGKDFLLKYNEYEERIAPFRLDPIRLRFFYTLPVAYGSYIVRKRGRDERAHVEIAPAFRDRVERCHQFVDVEERDELHPRGLEVGQPLEVVRQVAPHF